jgi:hypothetical protein
VEEIKPQGGEGQDKAQIRLDDSGAAVSYANFFLVTTNPEEFVLSFGIRTGDSTTVKVDDKVVVSPKNFKRMVAAVSQALRMYEERIGTIDTSVPNLTNEDK